MTQRRDAFRRYQSNIALFSRHVVGYPLYRYQTDWAQYVLQTVAERRSEQIVIKMPRQSGKNETSAQLEIAILARFGARGGEIVKCAPTFKPQVLNSKLRFDLRSKAVQRLLPWLRFKSSMGYMVRLNRAGISFFSAEPNASVVGATASLLLEVDEAQDVSPAKFDKDFSPMRASTAAPLVAYGTVWTDDTLLETFTNDVQEGRQAGRIFIVTPDQVAAENPAYGAFVDSEVARLGRQHPSVRTQYYLEPLENRGRLITTQMLRQSIGDHPRKEQRGSESVIVAGLDWAGADESAELVSLATLSKRDSVALVIGSVTWNKPMPGVTEPVLRILARYEWVNVHPLSMHATLYDLLQNKWRVNRLHADATGIGATGTALLAKALDNDTGRRVQPVTFDGNWNTHTDLASQYIAIINGSRLLDYKPAGFDPIAISGQPTAPTASPDQHIWWQRGHARLEARAGQRYRAYVPDAEGHDDLLLADMLMVDAAYHVNPVGELKQHQRKVIGR